MPRFLGVDPGVSGALAIVDRVGTKLKFVAVTDVVMVGEDSRQRVDIDVLARWLDSYMPIDDAIIEAARLRPPLRATSGGTYMMCAGYLECLVKLAGLKPKLIEPQVWKKTTGLQPVKVKGEAADKRARRAKQMALAKARRIFPDAELDQHQHHNRAEALLLAVHLALNHRI